MNLEPRFDIIGAALADPSRARILCELMDGRAFTNKELASAAGITAQTTTAHLQHLQGAGLTTSLRSGRCVYHRIANAEVAEVLEKLATLSPTAHLERQKPGKGPARDARLARSCYNHIAGRLGVLITRQLAARGVLVIDHETAKPGVNFNQFCASIGLEPPVPRRGTALVKPCLDWTERRHHIAGPFGTALMDKMLRAGWLHRQIGNRALVVTAAGYSALDIHFGLNRTDLDALEVT